MALFLALLSLFAAASSVEGERVEWSKTPKWSSNVTIQISKEGSRQAAACSDAALSALKTVVRKWLRDELINLFGEGAFTLGPVTGVEDGKANTISLVVSFECLECSKVVDKDAIDYILLFFMQHMMDEWIKENYADVLAGCMGKDTHVSNVFVGGTKAVSIL
jgi:hypothetical protein